MIRTSHSGMTIVETLIALGIFSAIVVTLLAFQSGMISTQKTASGSFATAQDAQILMKSILTELRAAAPGVNGSYPLSSAGTSSLIFFSDPDGNGQTEQIAYRLIGTAIYRAVTPPAGSPPSYSPANTSTSTLLSNVRNPASLPLFEYFDQSYTGTSSPLAMPVDIPSVKLIRVSVSLDADPDSMPEPRTYSLQVGLRNLKTNL